MILDEKNNLFTVQLRISFTRHERKKADLDQYYHLQCFQPVRTTK